MSPILNINSTNYYDNSRAYLMLMIGALESYKKGDISTDQLHAYVFTPATETTMAEMPCHKTIPELISENLYYEDDYNPDTRIRMADVAIAKSTLSSCNN